MPVFKTGAINHSANSPVTASNARIARAGYTWTAFVGLPNSSVSLADQAAGDPVSGISGGIGLHVVRLGMNHQGSAPIAEYGILSVS